VIAALLLFTLQVPQIKIDDPVDEPLRTSVQKFVEEGVSRNVEFFGKPYPKAFKVEVVPSRAAFDKIFKERWGVEHTESWAVAAGVADGLYLLSPRVWKTEATEHDPNDPGHIQRIVAHELTHVYHGQLNPSKDFDGMDDLAWLIEGVATYVSGQMDHEHKGQDVEAIKNGKAPKELVKAWTGQYRYAISGSIVQYVDMHYGREKLTKILTLTKQSDIMEELQTTEEILLNDWKSSVSP
jgi:hypothetical protein